MGTKKRLKVVSTSKTDGKVSSSQESGLSDDPGDDSWNELIEQYPNDPRLVPSFIYALPDRLLDLLQDVIPSLLTNEDLQFERRLRALGGSGFRNRRAFGYEVLDLPYSGEVGLDLFPDKRQQMMRECNLGLHDVFASRSNGAPERLVEARQMLRSRLAERLQGFVGWLVTNPQFRQETAKLAERWQARPVLQSTFPELDIMERPVPICGSGEELHHVAKTYGEAIHFLKRWNLVRMDTWDLPVPVAPVYLTDDPLPKNEIQSMGVSLFIPWSLLADRDLKFDEVLDYHRERQNLSHLENWTSTGRATSWGVERHAKMFLLFVYLDRALKVRYPGRLRGHTSMLDTVFRTFWRPTAPDADAVKAGADTVRKTREELQRRLKAIP